jgi:DNA-3-methyladenine glycosylase
MSKLPPSFYEQPTFSVATALLGKILVRRLVLPERTVVLKGKIVETEAYLAHPRYADESCHAYRGMTERNAAMFGEPGTVYVYFTYGNHFMLNIVTEPKGEAAAVLIRAIEPLTELDFIHSRRNRASITELTTDRANSPKPLRLTHAQRHEFAKQCALWEDAPPYRLMPSAFSTRIGITKGIDLPWRYFIKGNPFVSKGKPSGDLITHSLNAQP